MKSIVGGPAVAALLVCCAGGGCSLLNAPDEPTPTGGSAPAGGTGGATSSGGNPQGGNATGGNATGGSATPCNVPEDCPGPAEPCRYRACIGHTCTVTTPEAGTVCEEGSCVAGVASLATCDGDGTCVAGTTQICSPYACNLAATACLETCTLPGDCGDGFDCNSLGDCVELQPLGALCATGAECASGFCPSLDGICCDAACDSSCQGCTLSRTGHADGTCADVAAGTDPDEECPGAEVCWGLGSCTCVPTGARAAFNSKIEDTTAGCVSGDPCPDDTYNIPADYGPVFLAAGQRLACAGAASCVAHVGVATHEVADACQGLWDVMCDDVSVGTLDTMGRACVGSAMTNGCAISFSPRICSTIRLVALTAPTSHMCCQEGTVASIIVAVSAW